MTYVQRLTDTERATLEQLLHAGATFGEAGKQLGYNASNLKWFREECRNVGKGSKAKDIALEPAQVFEVSEDGFSATAISDPSPEFHTLDAFLSHTKPDLERWEVAKWLHNNWAQNWQVKVWYKQREGYQALADLTLLREELLEEVKRVAPPVARKYVRSQDAHLAVVHIPDLHIGKQSAPWSDEDWGIDGSVAAYEAALENLLGRGANNYDFERILFVLGSDFMHTDNRTGTTTGGTPVQPSHDYHTIFRAARHAATDAIQRCLELAPTDIITVPGNHDYHGSVTLGEALEARFHNDADVRIDNSDYARKYYDWGNNGFGFAHGEKVKPKDMVAKMAVEAPRLLQLAHRQIQLGHRHTELRDEVSGTLVMSQPSLAPTDIYHEENGYVGNIRSAMLYIYDFEYGMVDSPRYVLR